MASSACTGWETRPYLGAWEAWTTNFSSADSDGYCYKDSKYAFCFYFKTPSVSKFHKSTSLSITIPVIRTSSTFAKSGTLYFKLLTSDPTGGSITDNLKPTASNCNAYCSWNISDQQVHRVSFTINSTSLKANTGYYITVGGTKTLGIGYLKYTPDGGWWSATFNYETYTDVTANTPIITDNKNNTFTVVASAGKAGTNNVVNSTALYYRIGDSGGYTPASSLTAANKLSCAASAASQTVYAYTKVDGQHNDATSETASLAVINYQPPNEPGKPSLTSNSFKNNRLTVKQNWTFTWTAASATNTSSSVRGYWIRIWHLPKGTVNWTIVKTDEWENTTTTYAFNPLDFGFAAGDKVQLEVAAYSKNGAGTKLWSSITGTYNYSGQTIDLYTLSDQYLIENAGVVNVKVGGAWKEGQVYTKVNGVWKEAETINVKVNGAWKESQ